MNYLKKIVILLFLLPLTVVGREIIIEEKIEWEEPVQSQISAYANRTFLAFKNAQYDNNKEYLPFFAKFKDSPRKGS